jgi:hypothetical protein
MRQYSVDQVEVSWFGLDLTPGFAQGAFFQPTRNAPTWTQKPDGHGGVVQLYNPDRSGFITFLIDAESKVHQQLTTLANVDLVTRAIAGPIVVRDLSTNALEFYNRARIQTEPDTPKAVGPTTIPWVFLFETTIKQSFDFDGNVVGA